MRNPVGIRSMSLCFPKTIRTNDYYKNNYPKLYAKAEQKGLARLFSSVQPTPSNEFESEMMPYLSDPFRGVIERRIIGPGESSLTLEYQAATEALEAAELSTDEVDLLIVCSLLPENVGLGNAAFLARELGLKCAAWNIDATCCSSIIALQTATAMVQTGLHRNALVVVSCTYSRFFDESDTYSWFFSDGAGACVVDSLKINQGILGAKTINTCALCDQLYLKQINDEQGNPRLRIHVSKHTNKAIAETAKGYILSCCEGALSAAGVSLDEIDFFIFNTPTAWFSSFCIRVLGIDPQRTINVYPAYSNIGPALTLANLYHAAQAGKIREHDLVLLYGFGAASSASATVIRWGNVALGPVPAAPLSQLVAV